MTGDVLLSRAGEEITVEDRTTGPCNQLMFNFHVERLECYAVGNNGVLVHNNSCIVNEGNSVPIEGAAESVVAPSTQSLELPILNRGFVPDTQRVLQKLTDLAVADLAANPRLARDLMSPGRYAQLRNGTSLADASYGKAVERLVARYVQEDEMLSSILRHTGTYRGPNGRFISSPDFIGKEAYNLRLLDITTPKAIPRHLLRPGFGRSSDFITHPGRGTTQFP